VFVAPSGPWQTEKMFITINHSITYIKALEMKKRKGMRYKAVKPWLRIQPSSFYLHVRHLGIIKPNL